MCIYNTISSCTDLFEIQKRDSEESLLTFVNLFHTKKIVKQKHSSIIHDEYFQKPNIDPNITLLNS